MPNVSTSIGSIDVNKVNVRMKACPQDIHFCEIDFAPSDSVILFFRSLTDLETFVGKIAQAFTDISPTADRIAQDQAK